MNYIDKYFNLLVEEINSKSLENIYNEIKESYLNIPTNTQNSLEDFLDKFPYWGKLNIKNNEYESLFNRAKSIKEHINDYIWLYNHLFDYRSKKLLLAILRNWYKFDSLTLSSSLEKNYHHYFDLDLIPNSKDEVFVDIGSYTGDTIIDYLNIYGLDSYKNIYCYEITKNICHTLKNNLSNYPNIHILNKAISNKKETLYLNESTIDNSANKVLKEGKYKVESTTIDLDIKEKITLIKMDIEGDEKKAIEGCQNHIINDHPKLLISVYHNHEDLYQIPLMINNLDKSYKYYLRCYGNHIFPTEIVLIAI